MSISSSSVALCLAVGYLVGAPTALAAAELEAKTVAAFDRYVRMAEGGMEADVRDSRLFLFVDARPPAERAALMERLRRGEVVMERLRVRDAGKKIDVPDGMLHHWVGLVFLPGVKTSDAVALLQAYDTHSKVFAPAVVRSTLRARDGDRFDVYLRFYMKKVIAVTMDTENAAAFTTLEPGRVYSMIRSTRVNEVEHAAGAPEA
jgi:hypothetical protein